MNSLELNSSVNGVDFGYIFMGVIFAIFIAFWTVFVLTRWRSLQSRLSYLWKNGLQVSTSHTPTATCGASG